MQCKCRTIKACQRHAVGINVLVAGHGYRAMLPCRRRCVCDAKQHGIGLLLALRGRCIRALHNIANAKGTVRTQTSGRSALSTSHAVQTCVSPSPACCHEHPNGGACAQHQPC